MGIEIRIDVIVQSHVDEEREWWLATLQSAELLLGRDYKQFCRLAGICAERTGE